MITTSLSSALNPKKEPSLSEEDLKSSLIQRNLNNVKHFLNAYKESSDTSLLSKEFTSDSSVFMKVSQIPDCWTKTRIPFNRHLVFNQNLMPDKSRHFNKKPHHRAKPKATDFHLAPNYYPKVPFILSAESQLMATKKEAPQEVISKPKEAEMVFSGLTKKSWMVTYSYLDEMQSYGPMNSLKVYAFLKTLFTEMKGDEKMKKSIMIVDALYDVHYQPESLFHFLDEEYNRNRLTEDSTFNANQANEKMIPSLTPPFDAKEEPTCKRDSTSEDSTSSSPDKKEDALNPSEVN